MAKTLNGIIAAVMTPLTPERRLDSAAFERIIDFQLRQETDAIFVLGGCGEFGTLTLDIKKQLVDIAFQKIQQRVPLVVGIAAHSTSLVLENMETYAIGKADYVLTLPPGYLPIPQNTCEEFYLEVADKSPVPVVVYNCPEELTMNSVEPETIARLADHPNIAAMKDSSTMIGLVKMFLAVGRRDDFVLMSGWEDLFIPALSLGIDTFTMGGPGNMYPGLCRDILRKYQAGQQAEALELFLRMTKFQYEIYGLPCGALSAIKAVMNILNLCDELMAAPTPTADEKQCQFIRQAMLRSGLFEAVS